VKALLAVYRDLLGVLPTGAKRFISTYSVLLSMLALLDAASLGLLALVVSPLSAGKDVTLPVVGTLSDAGVLVTIAVICLLTISKGLLSVLLLWWGTRRFARYELEIGSRLFDSYIKAPWTERLRKNSAELVRLTDTSVDASVSTFLLPGSTILGEIMSLVAVVTVLVIVQPLLALVTTVYLGLIGMVLYVWVASRTRLAGRANLTYSLKTARLITEIVGAMKELTLRNKNAEVAAAVRESRTHTTRAHANIQFLVQVPRYVLESGIIGGFVLVGGVGYLSGGVPSALTAVALFGLAGFRMAPSVVRLQAVVSFMTSSAPQASRIVEEIRASERASAQREGRPALPLPDAPESLELRGVTFRYADRTTNAVDDVSLTIPFGSSIAVVGASGSGKSTLIDLILGLIEPTKGDIFIDGLSLTEVTHSWRARVGYVPQDVALFDATVAENVALCWEGEVDRERVTIALRQAQLLATFEAREGGIDGRIGERGIALSGGQRQRLGIARALYADPLVLVMDEATSALDTETEKEVTQAIKGLRGHSTMIVVAHRLSTVMDSDRIFFMREGRLVAQGSFQELVASVPDFARQATLAGLA